MAAAIPFSVSQSDHKIIGHPLNLVTASRYKLAGILGSLFDFTNSSQIILRLKPQMQPCMGNPYGFSLSYPVIRDNDETQIQEFRHTSG